MARNKKLVLLRSCVVNSKNCKQFDEVEIEDAAEAQFLIGCGNAANPETEQGADAIRNAKADQPKAAKSGK